MSRMLRDVDWSVVVLISVLLASAIALFVVGRETEGTAMLTIATGFVLGLPFSMRKGGKTIPPPPPSLWPVAIGAVCAAFALTGCGGSGPSAGACNGARAVVRAANEVVENYCAADAGVDAGRQ